MASPSSSIFQAKIPSFSATLPFGNSSNSNSATSTKPQHQQQQASTFGGSGIGSSSGGGVCSNNNDIFAATKSFFGGLGSAVGVGVGGGAAASYDAESGGTASSSSASGGLHIGNSNNNNGQQQQLQMPESFAAFANNIGGMFKNAGVKSGLIANTDAPSAADPSLAEASYLDELGEMTTLSPQQRLYGFLIAIGMGAVFIWIAIGFVLSGTIVLFAKKFAFFFTCGNFFIVCAPSFLVGPRRQMQTMTESHRLQAVMLYGGCTVLTLVSALYLHSSILSVAFAVTQVGSVVWYGLSFIPFARHVLTYTFRYLSVILKPLLSALWMVLQQLASCCFKIISR